MEYRDFDVLIGAASRDHYPVRVLRSPAGEVVDAAMPRWGELDGHGPSEEQTVGSTRSADREVILYQDRAAPGNLVSGRRLFEGLFRDGVLTCYRLSREIARAERKGLRLRLRIEPPEVAALPWEQLYDPDVGDYVSLSTETPVVRYMEASRPPRSLAVDPPLRILGMVSSPSDLSRLDFEAEQQRMADGLAPLMAGGRVTLEWLEGQTWRDLLAAMRAGPWHVFHFVGHGGVAPETDEGYLALADDDGRSALLPAMQLGRVLADHESLRLVVLNSCSGSRSSSRDAMTSSAAKLIARGVPAVIAMQQPLSDGAAVEFAREFYRALSDSMPVDGAVSEGRKAISISDARSEEWSTPVLHMRAPDGQLFHVGSMLDSAGPASAGDREDMPELPTFTGKGWLMALASLLVALAIYAILVLT